MSDCAKVFNRLSFNKDCTDVPQNASEFSLPQGNSGLESSNRDLANKRQWVNQRGKRSVIKRAQIS